MRQKKYFNKRAALPMTCILLIMSCHDDVGDPWRITVGLDAPKEKILYEGDQPEEVRLCLDKKGGSGYPTRVIAKFDDQRYANILEGQCMFFVGKLITVRFGNPSSGKFANGTYKIIKSEG